MQFQSPEKYILLDVLFRHIKTAGTQHFHNYNLFLILKRLEIEAAENAPMAIAQCYASKKQPAGRLLEVVSHVHVSLHYYYIIIMLIMISYHIYHVIILIHYYIIITLFKHITDFRFAKIIVIQAIHVSYP